MSPRAPRLCRESIASRTSREELSLTTWRGT